MRAFIISALIFFPLRIVAIYIEPLAFLHSSLTTAFALGVGYFMSTEFQVADKAEQAGKTAA